jgi:hypothetical protein
MMRDVHPAILHGFSLQQKVNALSKGALQHDIRPKTKRRTLDQSPSRASVDREP